MTERNCHHDFDSFSDATLANFIIKCQNELERRAQEREMECQSQLRNKWVKKLYEEFCDNVFASARVIGEVTVVAVYRWSTTNMATSTPVHGDVYDEKVGVAVAYAKAMGLEVPDYI